MALPVFVAVPAVNKTEFATVTIQDNENSVTVSGEGFAVAVLNHLEPVFYCVPAKAYEALMDYMDELELAALAAARADQPEIEVDSNTL